jgi:hypothetical protein
VGWHSETGSVGKPGSAVKYCSRYFDSDPEFSDHSNKISGFLDQNFPDIKNRLFQGRTRFTAQIPVFLLLPLLLATGNAATREKMCNPVKNALLWRVP